MRELETLVQPVVEGAGLELVDVTFHSGRGGVLRITVDREGGVDLDTIADVSERISRRLDIEGFNPGPYTLEVTSPGVERPLRQPTDFQRRIGQTVKVTASTGDVRRTLTGSIADATADSVTVASGDGVHTIAYDDIDAARTVLDWPRGQKKKGER